MNWLAAWGVTTATGFAFKQVLEPLAKDVAKDWLKDFCKGAFKEVLEKPEQHELKRAAGLSVKEFLALFQQELEDADLSGDDLILFEGPLNYFVREKTVLEILGAPMQPDFQKLDVAELDDCWRCLETGSPELPNAFDWGNIAKRYPGKVKAIFGESDKLRAMLG